MLCLFCIPELRAQDDFAIIRKNLNVRAKDLRHDLNKTKDTLILSSVKKIFRVYTVGGYSGLIDHNINTKKFKVSLRRLRKGKYVFVVDQLNVKIVFQVHVLRNYFDHSPFPENADAIVSVPDKVTKKEDIIRDTNLKVSSLIVETVPIELVEEEVAVEEKLYAVEEKTVVVSIDPQELEDSPVIEEALIVIEEKNDAIVEKSTTVINKSNAHKEKLEKERILVARILRAKSSGELSATTKNMAEVKTSKKEVIKSVSNSLDPKSYNLTDYERENVQNREDARKELAIARKIKSNDDCEKKNE